MAMRCSAVNSGMAAFRVSTAAACREVNCGRGLTQRAAAICGDSRRPVSGWQGSDVGADAAVLGGAPFLPERRRQAAM